MKLKNRVASKYLGKKMVAFCGAS